MTRALEGEQGDEARQETEPIEFESTDLAETLKMFENIRGIQKEMHKKYMVECRKRAKGKTEYELGQYVLVWYPRTAKFEECWRGPYLVAEKEGENIYIIEDLLTHEKMRVHVNRMHDFWPGTLTAEELKAESAGVGEYIVEKVHDHHRGEDGELYFKLKLLGWPEYEEDDPEQWYSWANCHYSPVVREYMKAHSLQHKEGPAERKAKHGRKRGEPRGNRGHKQGREGKLHRERGVSRDIVISLNVTVPRP